MTTNKELRRKIAVDSKLNESIAIDTANDNASLTTPATTNSNDSGSDSDMLKENKRRKRDKKASHIVKALERRRDYETILGPTNAFRLQRMKEAWDLRVRGATINEIAQVLGVSHRYASNLIVDAQVLTVKQMGIGEATRSEMAQTRAELIFKEAMDAWYRSKVEAIIVDRSDFKKTKKQLKEQPIDDDLEIIQKPGDPRFLYQATEAVKLLAKLQGLDVKKVDVSVEQQLVIKRTEEIKAEITAEDWLQQVAAEFIKLGIGVPTEQPMLIDGATNESENTRESVGTTDYSNSSDSDSLVIGDVIESIEEGNDISVVVDEDEEM